MGKASLRISPRWLRCAGAAAASVVRVGSATRRGEQRRRIMKLQLRNSRRLRSVMVAVAVAAMTSALVVPSGEAQVLYGAIVGNVRDTSGAAMPGATVTITNNATQLT